MAGETLRRLADADQQDNCYRVASIFQVTMVRGIFRFMQADHLFRSVEPGITEMTDRFCIAAPLPVLGPVAEALFQRRYMLALLRERNTVIKQVAESSDWQRYLQSEPDQERCSSL